MMMMAQEFAPPAGMASWTACLFFLVFALERARALYLSMQPRPPMDAQIRALEDRLNTKIQAASDKIDAEIDTVSDWVAKDFATKAELGAAQEFNAEARRTKMEQINALTNKIEALARDMNGVWEKRTAELDKKLYEFSIDISNKVGELRGKTMK